MTNTVSDRITDQTLSCAIQIESGGRSDVKASTSTATGLGQFIKATWLGVVRKHRPDLLSHYAESTVLDMRKNPSLSIELLARFWEDNMDVVGADCTPGDLYLAHFLGAGAARKVFRAPGMFPVEQVVDKAAVKANVSILQGKTCQQVRDWATRRMAQSDGHNWVAKFYKADDPLVLRMDNAAEPDIADDDAAPVKVEEPEITDVPENAPPHGAVDDRIANVQIALVAMNYNEVGIVDGAWGGGTAAAIQALLNDRQRTDLPVDMSKATLDYVAQSHTIDKWVRPISEVRANITPKDLALNNTTMLATLRTKALAFWGMLASIAATAFNAVSTYFHSLWDTIAPVRKMLDNVPGFVWVVLAGVACVLLYINAHRAEKDTTEAFQNRRLLR